MVSAWLWGMTPCSKAVDAAAVSARPSPGSHAQAPAQPANHAAGQPWAAAAISSTPPQPLLHPGEALQATLASAAADTMAWLLLPLVCSPYCCCCCCCCSSPCCSSSPSALSPSRPGRTCCSTHASAEPHSSVSKRGAVSSSHITACPPYPERLWYVPFSTVLKRSPWHQCSGNRRGAPSKVWCLSPCAGMHP